MTFLAGSLLGGLVLAGGVVLHRLRDLVDGVAEVEVRGRALRVRRRSRLAQFERRAYHRCLLWRKCSPSTRTVTTSMAMPGSNNRTAVSTSA